MKFKNWQVNIKKNTKYCANVTHKKYVFVIKEYMLLFISKTCLVSFVEYIQNFTINYPEILLFWIILLRKDFLTLLCVMRIIGPIKNYFFQPFLNNTFVNTRCTTQLTWYYFHFFNTLI